jgi:uncharacterized protein with GYD domain
MATYIALCNFTDQGIRNVKETTKRAEAVKQAAKKLGVDMRETYWTVGQYDLVAVLDAPDEDAATAFALSVGMAGNVRTTTLRAFTAEQLSGILAKVP